MIRQEPVTLNADIAIERDRLTSAGPLFYTFSLVTAAILCALVVATTAPAFEGRPEAAVLPLLAPADSNAHRERPGIIVYLMASEAEAERLRLSFEAWDQAIRDGGMEAERLTRIVIAEGPDDVLLKRLFDFSYIRSDGKGAEFRIVDLRN